MNQQLDEQCLIIHLLNKQMNNVYSTMR